MVSRARAVEGFAAMFYGDRELLYEMLTCSVLAAPLMLATALLPFATFLLLFTTLGNSLRRALRAKSMRPAYRFDLRALFAFVTFTAVSLAWLSALHEDGRIERYVTDWLLISIPLAFSITVTRFVLDVWDDAGRHPVVSLPERLPPLNSQDSPAADE